MRIVDENGRGGVAEAEADVVVGGAGAVGVAGATDVDAVVDAVAGASAGVPAGSIVETCGGVGDPGGAVSVESDSDELFLTDTAGERSRLQMTDECTEAVGEECMGDDESECVGDALGAEAAGATLFDVLVDCAVTAADTVTLVGARVATDSDVVRFLADVSNPNL